MRTFFSESYPFTGNRGAFVVPPSDYVDERVLAANVSERHTIPAGAKIVVFSANADFRAKFGSSSVTASVPNSDVTDGSASELNPAARLIPDGVTHIAVIAPAATSLTLSFYGV